MKIGKLETNIEKIENSETKEIMSFGVFKKEKIQYDTFYTKDENGNYIQARGNRMDSSPRIFMNLDEVKDGIELLTDLHKQLKDGN